MAIMKIKLFVTERKMGLMSRAIEPLIVEDSLLLLNNYMTRRVIEHPVTSSKLSRTSSNKGIRRPEDNKIFFRPWRKSLAASQRR